MKLVKINNRVKTDDVLVIELGRLLNRAQEPLSTKEIENRYNSKHDKKITRKKVLYRLQKMARVKAIKGKKVGPGKGTWIWYKHPLLNKKEEKVIFVAIA